MEMNVKGSYEQNRIVREMYNKGDKSLIYFFFSRIYAHLSFCLYTVRSILTPSSTYNFFFVDDE
jgi:hypothetical protein